MPEASLGSDREGRFAPTMNRLRLAVSDVQKKQTSFDKLEWERKERRYFSYTVYP